MVAAFAALFVYLSSLLSKSRRRCFAADDGSVSGDGRRLRCCTVGELLRDCRSVSVIGVREKCDEKGLRADKGAPQCQVSADGKGPLSKSARKGAPPVC